MSFCCATFGSSSVTRLDNFWNVLVTIFLAIVDQIFGNFLSSIGFCWVLFNWILLISIGSVEFNWVLLSSIGFCWVLLDSVELFCVVLGSVAFYWVALCSIGFCWVLLGRLEEQKTLPKRSIISTKKGFCFKIIKTNVILFFCCDWKGEIKFQFQIDRRNVVIGRE